MESGNHKRQHIGSGTTLSPASSIADDWGKRTAISTGTSGGSISGECDLSQTRQLAPDAFVGSVGSNIYLHSKREAYETQPIIYNSSNTPNNSINNNINNSNNNNNKYPFKDSSTAYFNYGGSDLLVGMRQPSLSNSRNQLRPNCVDANNMTDIKPNVLYNDGMSSVVGYSRVTDSSRCFSTPYASHHSGPPVGITGGIVSNVRTYQSKIERIDSTEGEEEKGSESGGGGAECVVCGDKSSGKHYGQHTCEGCKSFFKRSVRRELSYSCRGNRSCRVDTQHRNQCQYCRFQKCIKAGMRKEAVQRGRIPPTYHPSYSCPSSNLADPHSSPGSLWTATDHQPSQGLGDGNVGQSRGSPTSSLLGRVLKAEANAPIPLADTPNDQWIQILIGSVEWARRMPHFLDLHLGDCLVLLSSCWHELFLLNFLQCGLASNLPSLFMNPSSLLDPLHLRLIQDQMDRLSKIYPDSVEFACLKAITLFNPDVCGLVDTILVESVQEGLQCALEEHSRLTYPGQTSRFGRLLLRLPPLRSIQAHVVEQVFFGRGGMSGSGKHGPVETLLREILLGSAALGSPGSLPDRRVQSDQLHHSIGQSCPPTQGHHHPALMTSSSWTNHYPFSASQHTHT